MQSVKNQTRKQLLKKLEKLRAALEKENFEKKFWLNKVRYYAPNRMEAHYAELDIELQKVGFYTNRLDEDKSK